MRVTVIWVSGPTGVSGAGSTMSSGPSSTPSRSRNSPTVPPGALNGVCGPPWSDNCTWRGVTTETVVPSSGTSASMRGLT